MHRRAWEHDPTLSECDVAVAFADYLAARLATRLRDVDQEQNPELYDSHRKYLGERNDIPLEEELTPDQPRANGYSSNDPDSFLVLDTPHLDASWHTRLHDALKTHRIEVASQGPLASVLYSIAIGETRSPYQFARRLGETTQAARSHPATGPYLAALDVLGIDPNDPRTHPVATAPQTR